MQRQILIRQLCLQFWLISTDPLGETGRAGTELANQIILGHISFLTGTLSHVVKGSPFHWKQHICDMKLFGVKLSSPFIHCHLFMNLQPHCRHWVNQCGDLSYTIKPMKSHAHSESASRSVWLLSFLLHEMYMLFMQSKPVYLWIQCKFAYILSIYSSQVHLYVLRLGISGQAQPSTAKPDKQSTICPGLHIPANAQRCDNVVRT